MVAMFAFLDGISPWWWVAFALLLGAVELTTFSYYLLWLALAALSVAGVLVISPGLTGIGQTAAFCLLAVIYTLAGWILVQRNRPLQAEGPLNNRASALIGRQAVVAGAFSGGIGPVEVDGIQWRGQIEADATPPALGDVFKVAGTDGILLVLARSG